MADIWSKPVSKATRQVIDGFQRSAIKHSVELPVQLLGEIIELEYATLQYASQAIIDTISRTMQRAVKSPSTKSDFTHLSYYLKIIHPLDNSKGCPINGARILSIDTECFGRFLDIYILLTNQYLVCDFSYNELNGIYKIACMSNITNKQIMTNVTELKRKGIINASYLCEVMKSVQLTQQVQTYQNDRDMRRLDIQVISPQQFSPITINQNINIDWQTAKAAEEIN